MEAVRRTPGVVHLASNVTGDRLDLPRVSRLCRSRGLLLVGGTARRRRGVFHPHGGAGGSTLCLAGHK